MPADWTSRLGLDARQAERLDSALRSRDEALRPLLAQQRRNLALLDQQLRDRIPDAPVQRTLEQIDRVRRDIESVREQFRTETRSFLTPRQQGILFMESPGRTEAPRAPERGKERGLRDAPNDPPAADEDDSGVDPFDVFGGRDPWSVDPGRTVNPPYTTMPTPERPSPGPDLPSTPWNVPSQGGPNPP